MVALRIPTIRLLIGLLCSTAAVAVAAQAPDPSDAFVDPPSRVARLAFIAGPVSIAPADSDAWSEAFINRPLTSGDRIWVDDGARAELDVGTAIVRLDQNTSFSFVELTDDVLSARLNEGVVQFNVLRADQSLTVTTPGAVVTMLQPGHYTIDAAGSQTIVKNYDGAVDVSGGGSLSYGVGAGEQGVFQSTPSFTADIGSIGARSEFEAWAYARDAGDAAPVTSNYVASDMVGYRDLDRYGTWTSTNEYGYVWQPSYVTAGWAPYRYGRWIWVTPWGWTWVDDTPWGFAPFHYGRWVYLQRRWCWVPGPRYVRPVYAPALVGWIGNPYPGSVGWFPLAPREAYLPPCRTSWRYFRNINIANTTIINTTYINQAYYGRAAPFDYRYRHAWRATTVVTRDAFASGRPLGRHRAQPPSQIHWLAQGRPPTIEPSRASRFGVHTGVRPPQRVRSEDRQRQPLLTSRNRSTGYDVQRDGMREMRTPNDTDVRTTDRAGFRTPTDSHPRTPTVSSARPSGISNNGSASNIAIRTPPTATTLGDGRMRTPSRPAATRPDSRTPTNRPDSRPDSRTSTIRAPVARPSSRTPTNRPDSRTPTIRAPVASQPPTVQRSWSGRHVNGVSVDGRAPTTGRARPPATAGTAHANSRGITTNRTTPSHRPLPPPRAPTSNALRERTPNGTPPARVGRQARDHTTPPPREHSQRSASGQRPTSRGRGPSFGVRQEPTSGGQGASTARGFHR